MSTNGSGLSGLSGHSIGVDIGGTFTDTIVLQRNGAISMGKAPSTPPDFQTGFINSLRSAAERMGVSLDDLIAATAGLYHGCTVGTNALVEGRTAPTALLTTRGLRDTIFIMQAGGRHWGMVPEAIARVSGHRKPNPPLVPKSLIGEIDERIAFDGRVIVKINRDQCRRVVDELLEQGVKAFAVSLMWSVVNPEHELEVAEIVREASPDAFVSTSARVIPRTGEYERTVATVINSLIGPVMNSYLAGLQSDLAEIGYKRNLYVMSCSGGVIDVSLARELPLLTIGSGPVAGLIGVGNLVKVLTEQDESVPRHAISTDMGGTTFDVGVIRDGRPLTRATTRHGQYEYFIPTLDVRSIGAGGGSIIRFEESSGTLRVGPQSAGARPGPAAYERGGELATVTDADLVLGYLNPDYFLGGDMTLSLDAARRALERAGEPLGFDADATAAAACRIVDNQMSDAIRLGSVQQGYDPREHLLYAFGGAGPVHATALAKELGASEIIVPLSDLASGWSAFGIASADALVVHEAAVDLTYPFDPEELNRGWQRLEEHVLSLMTGQGVDRSELTLERSSDIRYTAQVNTLPIPSPDGDYSTATVDSLIGRFESEYGRLFGSDSGYPDAGYALTALRVSARAPRSGVWLQPNGNGASGEEALKGERGVIFYEQGLDRVTTPVYDGGRLTRGMTVAGPAILEFLDTTVVLRHGQSASIDALRNVRITT